MLLAFTGIPCNVNDKTYFKPLLERAWEARLMRRMKHFMARDEAGTFLKVGFLLELAIVGCSLTALWIHGW